MNPANEIILALDNGPRIIIPLVRDVPAGVVKRRPKPGKWSAHEHACHLAAVQPMIMRRLDLMLREQHPTIAPYYPDKRDKDGALLEVVLDEAMDRFVRERADMVERLRRLTDDDWKRGADHGEYSHYSVAIMFRHLALHDMLHAYRIEEALLKKDW